MERNNTIREIYLCLSCEGKYIYKKKTIGENLAIGNINQCPRCGSNFVTKFHLKDNEKANNLPIV